jgi:hypothetical protein
MFRRGREVGLLVHGALLSILRDVAGVDIKGKSWRLKKGR